MTTDLGSPKVSVPDPLVPAKLGPIRLRHRVVKAECRRATYGGTRCVLNPKPANPPVAA